MKRPLLLVPLAFMFLAEVHADNEPKVRQECVREWFAYLEGEKRSAVDVLVLVSPGHDVPYGAPDPRHEPMRHTASISSFDLATHDAPERPSAPVLLTGPCVIRSRDHASKSCWRFLTHIRDG